MSTNDLLLKATEGILLLYDNLYFGQIFIASDPVSWSVLSKTGLKVVHSKQEHKNMLWYNDVAFSKSQLGKLLEGLIFQWFMYRHWRASFTIILDSICQNMHDIMLEKTNVFMVLFSFTTQAR